MRTPYKADTWVCILTTAACALHLVGGFTPPGSTPPFASRIGVISLRRQCDLRLQFPAARSLRKHARTLRLLMLDGDSEGLSDADISGLLARVSAAKDRVQTLPLCVLDATLPRQRLEFVTQDKSFLALLAHCRVAAGGDGLGKFGMLGQCQSRPYSLLLLHKTLPCSARVCPLSCSSAGSLPGLSVTFVLRPSGVDRLNRAIMRHGTEVEITKADEQTDGSVAVELVGRGCFQLLGDPWLQEAGVDEEPMPAPLSSVAAATQDSSKYIMAQVEYAVESEDGVGSSMAGSSAEEMAMESAQMLDNLTGETDYEANLQMSAGTPHFGGRTSLPRSESLATRRAECKWVVANLALGQIILP